MGSTSNEALLENSEKNRSDPLKRRAGFQAKLILRTRSDGWEGGAGVLFGRDGFGEVPQL